MCDSVVVDAAEVVVVIIVVVVSHTFKGLLFLCRCEDT